MYMVSNSGNDRESNQQRDGKVRRQASYVSRSLTEALGVTPNRQVARAPEQKRTRFVTKVLDFLTMKRKRQAKELATAENRVESPEEEERKEREAESSRLLHLLGSYAKRHDNATVQTTVKAERSGKAPARSRFADFGKLGTQHTVQPSPKLSTLSTSSAKPRSPESMVGVQRKVAEQHNEKHQRSRLDTLMESYSVRYPAEGKIQSAISRRALDKKEEPPGESTVGRPSGSEAGAGLAPPEPQDVTLYPTGSRDSNPGTGVLGISQHQELTSQDRAAVSLKDILFASVFALAVLEVLATLSI
eukprot:CAMPEP_0181347602 /NCGR_PEP_ID=MMETSP1101-20121128/33966_1 /TAXON_ID=46948 /ORGANISM="Rhodomonas abbreviata, Strain Caron Lab Isolate" /LENGTH=302 /DNA_ID=CAMNT_0023459827 /DNA_START=217 /DNA_END=1125 /DNA_ORIENTATION=+